MQNSENLIEKALKFHKISEIKKELNNYKKFTNNLEDTYIKLLRR
tara:strand:- start:428 stop:562 length:135 start_codon:yes stop_codon:yes gene_type:complete